MFVNIRLLLVNGVSFPIVMCLHISLFFFSIETKLEKSIAS